MAGPCSVESQGQISEIAGIVADAGANDNNADEGSTA